MGFVENVPGRPIKPVNPNVVRGVLAYETAAERDRLAAENEALRNRVAELDRTRDALCRDRNEIELVLGKALGYPPDEHGEGVCPGEHTACSLADEAAAAIGRLTRERDELEQQALYNGLLAASYRKAGFDLSVGIDPRPKEEATAKANRWLDTVKQIVSEELALSDPDTKGAPDAPA